MQRYKLCMYREGNPVVESDDGDWYKISDVKQLISDHKQAMQEKDRSYGVALTNQMSVVGELKQFLHNAQEKIDILKADHEEEIEELRNWKEQALLVDRSWNAQIVGRLLGLLPGDSIHKSIEPGIRKLLEQIALLTAQLVEARKEFPCLRCGIIKYGYCGDYCKMVVGEKEE
jgi:hypothetical protein